MKCDDRGRRTVTRDDLHRAQAPDRRTSQHTRAQPGHAGRYARATGNSSHRVVYLGERFWRFMVHCRSSRSPAAARPIASVPCSALIWSTAAIRSSSSLRPCPKRLS